MQTDDEFDGVTDNGAERRVEDAERGVDDAIDDAVKDA